MKYDSHGSQSVSRKVHLANYDPVEVDFTVEQPSDYRSFLSYPFRKRELRRHLKGRASDYAFYLHERLSPKLGTSGTDDYLLPEHPLPVYKQNVLDYMQDVINTTRTKEYVDTQYARLCESCENHFGYLAEIDETIEYMLDPVSGSAAKNKTVLGIVCIHVDDVFLSGSSRFHSLLVGGLKRDFR